MARPLTFRTTRRGYIRALFPSGNNSTIWQIYPPQSPYCGTICCFYPMRLILADEKILKAIFDRTDNGTTI